MKTTILIVSLICLGVTFPKGILADGSNTQAHTEELNSIFTKSEEKAFNNTQTFR